MTVRHLRNSFWHMFIASMVAALFLTGCGRGEEDTDIDDSNLQSTDGSGNFTPSSGSFGAAGNISLDLLQTKLSTVPNLSSADEASLIDALRILNNPNATNQQLSDAMARAFQALMQMSQMAGVDRAKANAAIQKLAQQLAAKAKEIQKLKKKSSIMSGIKSILGMLINAAVGIIGMFKK